MAGRPAHIKQARIEGNTPLLSAAGRKGGHVTARRRALARDVDQLFAERKREKDALDEHQRWLDSGEADLAGMPTSDQQLELEEEA